jgi:hypothetical protein
MTKLTAPLLRVAGVGPSGRFFVVLLALGCWPRLRDQLLRDGGYVATARIEGSLL